MPEIVHYGGGSAIGLINVHSTYVSTPNVLMSNTFQNLGPLVPQPAPVSFGLPQVNFSSTDVNINGGNLNAQQVQIKGGSSANMFSINDSLHISKTIKFELDFGPDLGQGAGCVDNNGVVYFFGGKYSIGNNNFITQYIPNVSTSYYLDIDFGRWNAYSFAIDNNTPQTMYMGASDNNANYPPFNFVLTVETQGFTITGSLNFGSYTLHYPSDIKTNTSSGIYVADEYQGIFYFSTKSSLPILISTGGSPARTIALDSRGYLYATNSYAGNAYCITTNVSYNYDTGNSQLNLYNVGICVDSNFNVYVNYAYSDKIVKFFQNGVVSYVITLPYQFEAVYIAMSGFDNLYVWSAKPQINIYKSVIEINSITSLVADKFYGDGGNLSNISVSANSVIQPFTNLIVTGNTTSGNVIPAVDNLYSLGTSSFRWKNIQLGPGTIYMQDTVSPYQQAGLTIQNSQLLINGALGIQVGNVFLIDSVTGNTSQLTVTSGTLRLNNSLSIATGNITFLDTSLGTNANMNVSNKILQFTNVNTVRANSVIYSDGLTQSNAYIKPTSNVLPVTPYLTQLTVDMSSANSFIHCHTNTSININVLNPTPAKEVHIFIVYDNAGGPPPPYGSITCSGVAKVLTANTVDTNPYWVYQGLCEVRVTSLDTTSGNTFVVIDNYYHK